MNPPLLLQEIARQENILRSERLSRSDEVYKHSSPIEPSSSRTSRWWFGAGDKWTTQALQIVDQHRASMTGVYLFVGLSIGPDGTFRHHRGSRNIIDVSTQQFQQQTIQPFLLRNLTVTLVLDVDQHAIESGNGITNGGVKAAAGYAAQLNVTGLMVDYEPTTNRTKAHVEAYAAFLSALGKELHHRHGKPLELDMCVSGWGILDQFSVYADAQVDGMMSMASTYFGTNISSNEAWVLAELEQNVSLHQLRVGIGSTNSIFQRWDYQWTPNKWDEFLAFLNVHNVHHVDIWRTDIDSLNATNGTEQWVYDGIAKFLAGDQNIDSSVKAAR